MGFLSLCFRVVSISFDICRLLVSFPSRSAYSLNVTVMRVQSQVDDRAHYNEGVKWWC